MQIMKPIRLTPISESIHTNKTLHVNDKRLIWKGISPTDEGVEINEGNQNTVNRLKTIGSSLNEIRESDIAVEKIELLRKFRS